MLYKIHTSSFWPLWVIPPWAFFEAGVGRVGRDEDQKSSKSGCPRRAAWFRKIKLQKLIERYSWVANVNMIGVLCISISIYIYRIAHPYTQMRTYGAGICIPRFTSRYVPKCRINISIHGCIWEWCGGANRKRQVSSTLRKDEGEKAHFSQRIDNILGCQPQKIMVRSRLGDTETQREKWGLSNKKLSILTRWTCLSLGMKQIDHWLMIKESFYHFPRIEWE